MISTTLLFMAETFQKAQRYSMNIYFFINGTPKTMLTVRRRSERLARRATKPPVMTSGFR